MDDKEESRIIQRIQAGDRDAYAAIVEKYATPIYNLVLRMGPDAGEAQDLAQEIFLRVYRGLDGFDTSRRFFPWLYTIAVNVLRNHRRKTLGKPLTISAEPRRLRESGSPADPETLLECKSRHKRLEQAVRRLPAEQQEAVILRYYQDLAFNEIAEIQTISISSAKMRVYRALKRLARMMGDNENEST